MSYKGYIIQIDFIGYIAFNPRTHKACRAWNWEHIIYYIDENIVYSY